MGLTEIPSSYMAQSTGGGHVMVMEQHHHHHHHVEHHDKDTKMSSKKKMHLLKKIKKRFGLVRRSPSSCPGPNNLPPLQFHHVHGDNIRISRDGTLARRFESFCRAITFSARPVRINERICVKFAEISNNWNGGIRFGFTSNDPATLEGTLPKYACPDLTNRPGFWAKALHEQYCEKDNVLYYYVNSAGDVIYGINNEEKGVILSGIDTRGLLWTIIDIYGNCTGIEFLDARIYMYQQSGGVGLPPALMAPGMTGTLPGPQMAGLNPHHPNQQSRRSLPAGQYEHELERTVMTSMQSLNLTGDQVALASDLANGLPPLRYNANGRLIPVPFHITKGRNVRLSHDRFIASRTENDFCQGYVFTARPIRIGEKIIVQILKTEQMYVGALALGLTSCNPSALQPGDLPNDSDFLLDRPEYWVVSKDIAAAPQRGDEIAFFVAPNGEVTISKNNGPAVVVMHVDQSLQLWAFLDVYGSTQSVRMFRQQLPNMVNYPPSAVAGSSQRIVNIPVSESINSLNSQISDNRKIIHPSQLNVTHGTISASTSTLASMQSTNNLAAGTTSGILNGTCSPPSAGGRMISMPSNGEMIQIQPNGGGTVLVVNLPPATSAMDLNSALSASQARINQTTNTANAAAAGGNSCSSGASSSSNVNTLVGNLTNAQFMEPHTASSIAANNCASVNSQKLIDHSDSAGAECTICYENQIDSVLYSCGHMCMCYDCAIEQWRGVGGGQCPLCRAVIRDVIRTYTT
ncbi:protein neuralized isoform X1 [Lucilia sericata]|uniref:protein neuralized isoform X1 n=1 Tax=Lucilia sericata TaxID=13632 RepID=UPI0018A8505A|nr:protein neuralized isoform X1 [Lucilia sericata]